MSDFPSISAADIPQSAYLLDVREDYEYDAGHAAAAQHLPVGELPQRFEAELDPDIDYHVLCRTGGRSHQVCSWLTDHGYSVVFVRDGYDGWLEAGGQLTTDAAEDARIL